jgi:hypothetical protein
MDLARSPCGRTAGTSDEPEVEVCRVHGYAPGLAGIARDFDVNVGPLRQQDETAV